MHATKILGSIGDYIARQYLDHQNISKPSNRKEIELEILGGFSIRGSYELIGSNSMLEGMEYWETSLNSIQIHCVSLVADGKRQEEFKQVSPSMVANKRHR